MWKTDTIEQIDLELTSFCNIKCKACWRTTGGQAAKKVINNDLLPYGLIVNRIKKKYLPNLKTVRFCGSVDEPITHPEINELIDYFIPMNVKINISTNGSLKTVKWWKNFGNKFYEKNVNHTVFFGIDGLEDTHHLYRVGSDFSKVLNNAKAFIDAGGYAVWQYIVFEHNKHQIETAKKLAKEIGFSEFKILETVRRNGSETIKNAPLSKQIQAFNEVKCEFALQKRIFINHMGLLIPCCYLNAAAMKSMVNMGTEKNSSCDLFKKCGMDHDVSLYHNSIEKIINGKFWTEVIRSWKTDNLLAECKYHCKDNIKNNHIVTRNVA